MCFPVIRAIDQTYYIRVAALGDVAAQPVNPTGEPPDNTNWSGVIEAVPVDQPPSSPGPVSIYVLDGSTLQVHMEVPAESGGSDITQYVIDVDTVSTFSSTGLVSYTVEADEVTGRDDQSGQSRTLPPWVVDAGKCTQKKVETLLWHLTSG